MDAKRWSPLWVFVGGCLTGAVLIEWHARGAPSHPADDSSYLASQNAASQNAATRSGVGDPVHEHPAALQVSETERSDTPPPAPSGSAAPEKADDGNSVADVLARLETEYRERSAPAPTTTPTPASTATPTPTPAPPLPAPVAANDGSARAPSNEPPRELAQAPVPGASSVSDANASAANLAARDNPAFVLAAPAAEVAALPRRGPTFTVDINPTAAASPSAAESEEAARLASLRDEQAKALEDGQRQLAQMQQLTALQQATLAQQYTLYQLQLLSMTPAPRTPAPASPQRRAQAHGGRIVASRPSSISASGNPWGFDLQPSVLVR
jgi:hypothetical protein